jgi:parallel beta-helix repeat protein
MGSFKMKIRKTIFLITVIIALLLPILNQKNGLLVNRNEKININVDPIVAVNGNSGFSGSGFTGFGTESQPYILENKVIDGGGLSCISITDTDAYFIIRNCIIYNGTHGMELDNVTNGKIINVTSHSNSASGILIYQNCSKIKCIENTVYNNSDYGFYLFGQPCDNNLIHNNTIYNNTRGIYVFQGANFNNLTDNRLYEHSKIGIFLHSAPNSTATGNIIFNNDEGIVILNSNNASCTNNYIYDNNNGIRMESSDTGNVSDNLIKNNVDTGIIVLQSDSNTISWNAIHENAICLNETSSTGNNIFNNSCSLATLTEGGFNPSTGDTQTDFVYSVKYTDPDNLPPTSIKVIINGVEHDMTKLTSSDNIYHDGCIYVYTTTLPAGSSHTHYFEAGDLMDISRSPATGADLGPYVETAPIPGFTWIYGLLSILFVFGLILVLNRKKQIIII